MIVDDKQEPEDLMISYLEIPHVLVLKLVYNYHSKEEQLWKKYILDFNLENLFII